ncbi:SulP family inorganic anion transporter [Streptomyces sp. ISL-22]|uniref:SulP family inorganic anion transporter n=1 Tax=unclassified Streptomyces TaxID=2593676 RepID=UPI001BE9A1F4|nr:MULTISPECIES: SulP family inorganic anion transporter [unclassified Streptomyces]MBT2418859.1 SulP family inorganic anion transporter [Streptomyces sp. ISL-24]MBT2435708.1 SulP family inorganic anion transporter [Streptomyces sp. ISL-22]
MHFKLPALRPSLLLPDVTASLVVFLVAVPLCVGVAVTSGVPAELGLITGIVGGLVAGVLPGSSLQVSGPAAGLTVLVHEAVEAHGLAALGVIVLASGVLQLVLGAARCGRWFRAISIAVVQGMLAGIGLVLILGQAYAMADLTAPSSGLGKISGLPGLTRDIVFSADALVTFMVGTATIAVLILWKRLPGPLPHVLPAPLATVALATAAVAALGLPIARVDVQGLIESVQPPALGALSNLGDVALLGTVLAFTLIASAESLFSAAAVDRMHDGPRTDYDKELMAQGVGNTVCGLLGALPMTAVIVRSAANVQAGARTKLSRVLHGVWLLLFAALFPAALEAIPIAALAGVLVHAGAKLMPVKELLPLWRDHRGEAVVLAVTAIAIVVTNMFEGVLLGLLMAVAKTAWETSSLHVHVEDGAAGPIHVRITGNATFLRLPRILDTLEALPGDRPVQLDLSRLRHLDHACHTALTGWAVWHYKSNNEPVQVKVPDDVPQLGTGPGNPHPKSVTHRQL